MNSNRNFMSKITNLILRDTLALDRTRLANQRTLLAFVRTGLYLAVTGAGIFQFSNTSRFFWLAWSLIGSGILVASMGVWSYRKIRRDLKDSYG